MEGEEKGNQTKQEKMITEVKPQKFALSCVDSRAVRGLHQENGSRQTERKWSKLTLIANLALHTAEYTSGVRAV